MCAGLGVGGMGGVRQTAGGIHKAARPAAPKTKQYKKAPPGKMVPGMGGVGPGGAPM